MEEDEEDKEDKQRIEISRQQFSARLQARLDELGVPVASRATWLSEATEKRWQTAQFWLTGKSFPLGHNLAAVALAVGMRPEELIGPMDAALEPETSAWRAFAETPEGASLSDQERWILRLHPWMRPPTVGDYRALLALIRTNAER